MVPSELQPFLGPVGVVVVLLIAGWALFRANPVWMPSSFANARFKAYEDRIVELKAELKECRDEGKQALAVSEARRLTEVAQWSQDRDRWREMALRAVPVTAAVLAQAESQKGLPPP